MRHPREMGSAEVNAFLAHLRVNELVSATTLNQVLAACLFLCRDRLEGDLELEGVVHDGSGLRLMETLRLRVQYLDVNRRVLTVHNGKAERSAARCCLNAYAGRCSAIWRTCAESTTRIWQQVGSGLL
jgi:hypothetical protein